MNLAELQSAVYLPLRDSGREFVPQDDVTALLNDAYVDIATRLELFVVRDTGTISSGLVALPTDPAVHRILNLRLGSETAEFVDDGVFFSWQDSGDDPMRVLARTFGANIELYPEPTDGDSYSLEYIAVPSGSGTYKLLSAPTDEPALPTALVPKMVQYAQAHAFYASGDTTLGDRYLGIYEQGLPIMRKRLVQQPAPWTLTREGNTFDADPERKHA